jgi:hypothetical protein
MKINLGTICILLFTLLAACAPSVPNSAASATISGGTSPLTNLQLGLSFPPVSNANQRSFTKEQLDALEVHMIRFAEDWRNREPEKGTFIWRPLEERLTWVRENQISLLLTVQSNGPDWACDPIKQNERSCVYRDPQEFTNYINALLRKHPNQIDKIQFGNEWLSDYWYAGSANDFVQFNNILYEAVQRYSPQTQVVLGGIAYGTLEALAFCEDAINIFRPSQSTKVIEDRDVCATSEVLAARERMEYVLTNAHYDMLDLHFYDG